MILPGDFKVLPAGAQVVVGELVTVISHRDPAQILLVATGAVIQQSTPTTTSISGVITGMGPSTVNVGGTTINYDGTTVFALRGLPGTPTVTGYDFSLAGQQATVFFQQTAAGNLAKIVLVGANIPKGLQQLEKSGFDD